MRRGHILLAAGALALVSAGSAVHVQVPPPAVVAPGGDLDLGPNDEVVVREYIVRRHSAPIRFREDTTLRPGSIVPGYSSSST